MLIVGGKTRAGKPSGFHCNNAIPLLLSLITFDKLMPEDRKYNLSFPMDSFRNGLSLID